MSWNNLMIVAFSLYSTLWIIPYVDGNVNFQRQVLLDPEENIKLLWYIDGDMITFEVQANTTGYFGIGLSTNGGMKGADILLGWVKDGVPFISDRHGVGNEEPVVDLQNDYEYLYGSETNGLTTIGYRRKLATCDPDDLEITVDTIRVIWAYHPDDPSDTSATYHGARRRGVRSIVFLGVSSNLQSLPNDVMTVDLLNDNVHVPDDRDTTYWCSHFQLPILSDPHHIVRIEPIIQPENAGIVHHFILIECLGLDDVTSQNNSFMCQDSAMLEFEVCTKWIYGWAIGGGALDFPENAGFRIGGPESSRYLQLQIHYDNPELLKDIRDNSGVRLHYTPRLRQYDADMMTTGIILSPSMFMLPPGETNVKAYGACDAECSRKIFSEGNINIFAVFLHAHLAARGIRFTHYRDLKYMGEIARDNNYDFNLQEQRHLKEEWVVKPGDDLLTECTYDTTDRTKVTLGGEGTQDEMCMSMLMYYPKVNVNECSSVPIPTDMYTLLGTGTSKTARQGQRGMDNIEWTKDKSDAVREWLKMSPRYMLCSNASGHSYIDQEASTRGFGNMVETGPLDDLVDIQNQNMEEATCSISKAAYNVSWRSYAMLAIIIICQFLHG